MVKGMVGYPVLIESRFGSDSAAVSVTTISTTAIEHAEFPPELFAPPPDYREAGADSSAGAADEDSTAAAPPER